MGHNMSLLRQWKTGERCWIKFEHIDSVLAMNPDMSKTSVDRIKSSWTCGNVVFTVRRPWYGRFTGHLYLDCGTDVVRVLSEHLFPLPNVYRDRGGSSCSYTKL
jgi:hypothetical protein